MNPFHGTRKLHSLRRKGGIPKNFELRAGVWRSQYTLTISNLHWHGLWHAPQVLSRHLRHFPSLVAIHRRFGGLLHATFEF